MREKQKGNGRLDTRSEGWEKITEVERGKEKRLGRRGEGEKRKLRNLYESKIKKIWRKEWRKREGKSKWGRDQN